MWTLLHVDQNVQECDARMIHSNNTAWLIINIFVIITYIFMNTIGKVIFFA